MQNIIRWALKRYIMYVYGVETVMFDFYIENALGVFQFYLDIFSIFI